MTEARPSPTPDTLPYQFLCGLGLGLIFLMQSEQGILLLNLLTIMVGALGLLSKLRLGPIYLLLTLTFAQLLHRYFVGRGTSEALLRAGPEELSPILLAVGVLAYVLGHFRLQGHWHEAFPRDPRQRTGPVKRPFFGFRARRTVTPHRRPREEYRLEEIPALVISALLPAVAASLACAWLARRAGAFHDLPAWAMRPLWFLLGCGLAGFVLRHLLEIVRHRRMTSAEALLWLQDQVWRETRGEQRRIQRWWTWQRLRLAETGAVPDSAPNLPLGNRAGIENNVRTDRRPAAWGRRMRFWLRELAGWALVLLGLYLFLVLVSLLVNDPPAFLEAGPFLIIAIFVFRGGIHLLKVAVAARLCLEARRADLGVGETDRKPARSAPGQAKSSPGAW